MAEGETSQDADVKRPSGADSPTSGGKLGHRKKGPSEGHIPTGDGRGRDKSGYGKVSTERGILTNWRWQKEGQVRTQKGGD